MNSRFVLAVATFTALSQTLASANATASPSKSIVPISSSRVGVESAVGCDAPAAVDGAPYFEMPSVADAMNAHGTVDVKIDLTSSGKLAHEELFSSSGNLALDNAAMLAARLTQFTPETAGCRHVAGSYLFEVVF
jgi:TonB family protein